MKRVTNKVSHATVAGTVARLLAEVEARGLSLFTSRTCLSHTASAELAARYQLSDELAAGLSGTDGLTDAALGR
jgi:hypothetical protein